MTRDVAPRETTVLSSLDSMNRPSPTPRSDFTPTSAEELARFVADNSRQDQRPLIPCGGRTSLHYGGVTPEDGTNVSLSELRRIVDYPARDMTITVEAGMRVEDLQQLMAAEGQRLPIDVPQAHRATLGGAIASNTSGPGRFGHGTFRDYVIGISGVDGQGRLFSAGGRVVKNVAGYDLCKLLVGSLGTLAIITQVTLKLRPMVESRCLLGMALKSLAAIEAALQKLVTTATRPVAVEVLNRKAAWQIHGESRRELPIDRPVLLVGLEGSTPETGWQVATIRRELGDLIDDAAVTLEGDDADVLWRVLTEYQAASDDPLSFKATLPASRLVDFVTRADELDVALQCHAGNGIAIGHLPDSCSTTTEASRIIATLRDAALRSGGALVIHSCDADWKQKLDVFGPLSSEGVLMSRIKSALDPLGLLNPGRMTFVQAGAS